MSRASKIWLAAAGGVVVFAVAIVFAFGLTPAPEFPSLYDGGAPTVEGTVAYIDYDRDQCVIVMDVATGDTMEALCDDWLWLEGWDDNGNLRVRADNGPEQALVVDPATGQVRDTGEFPGIPPDFVPSLRATSHDGHATLAYDKDGAAVTLIDVEGPRQYSFWDYGLTADETFAWARDSEDRLLVVAVDGSGGPWIVAEDVNEIAWK